MLAEFDLAGAEWVVVAYLADDANMISVVESGKSPHVATGALISGAPECLIEREDKLLKHMTDPDELLRVRSADIPEVLSGEFFVPRTMTIRQCGKKSNHGLNYDMRHRKFALLNEMPERDAERIVGLYHEKAYPGIRGRFHADVKRELRDNDRTLTNLLGCKVRLLDQPGPDLWDSAYSYKPQSNVAYIVQRAMRSCYADGHQLMAPMEILANVHDSMLTQYPAEPHDRFVEFCQRVIKHMSPTLHCNGHEFTLGVDVKVGHDWDNMRELELPA